MNIIPTIIGAIISAFISFFIDYFLKKKYKKKFDLDTFCLNRIKEINNQQNNINQNNQMNNFQSFNENKGNIEINQSNTNINYQIPQYNTNKTSQSNDNGIIYLMTAVAIALITTFVYMFLRKNIYFNIFFPIIFVVIVFLNKYLFLKFQNNNSQELLNYKNYSLNSYILIFIVLLIFITPFANATFLNEFNQHLSVITLNNFSEIAPTFSPKFVITICLNILTLISCIAISINELLSLIFKKKSCLFNSSPSITSLYLFTILLLIYIIPNIIYKYY